MPVIPEFTPPTLLANIPGRIEEVIREMAKADGLTGMEVIETEPVGGRGATDPLSILVISWFGNESTETPFYGLS